MVEAACNRSEHRLEGRDKPVDPAIDGSCYGVASGKWRCHQRRQLFRYDDGCNAKQHQKAKGRAPDGIN